MSSAIHPSAIIDSRACIDEGVSIGPYSVIGAGARLHKGVRIHNHVTVTGNALLHENVELYPGCVVGAQPQIINYSDDGSTRLEIGARTILREHVTVHVGSSTHGGLTTIGQDCLLMIGCHIAHDCHVGDKCVIANDVQFAGHVTVDEQVWIGGLAAIHQFSRIGRHAFVGGGAILVDDVIPYGAVVGNHAHLSGLNIAGLKRRGFSKQTLRELRAAYKTLFAGDGHFADRVSQLEATYRDSREVMEIVEFIQSRHKRPICQPE